jgi:ATP-dependent Lhr-like helicase
VLAAVDPAQPYGGVLPWPAREGDGGRSPARVAGAYVVLTGGEPVLYLERGGRGLQTLVPAEDERIEPALGALAEEVKRGRIKRLALEKVDGDAAMSSALAPALIALGFQEGPRRMTLSA